MMSCLVIIAATLCATTLSVAAVTAPSSSQLPRSWSWRDGGKPDGYLLASLGTTFFKLEFNGSVSRLWTYPLGNLTFFMDNLYTFDVKKELMYLGVFEEFTALDLNTGEVRVRIPTPLSPSDPRYNYLSYDYVKEKDAIYGMCSNEESSLFWCRVDLHEVHRQKVKSEYLFEIPSSSEAFSNPSEFYRYYVDVDHLSLWYYLNINQVYGINATAGEFMFQGNDTLYYFDGMIFSSAYCIAYDFSLNRTLALHWDYLVKCPLLGELHHNSQNATSLMELPSSLRPVNSGSCAYYSQTHTMIVFMANVTTFLTDSMSYYIVLIDVVGLTYEVIPLPGLRELTNTDWIISAVKFVPNKK